MKIKLQLFGAFRQYSNEIELDLDEGCAISDLRKKLLDTLKEKKVSFNVEGLIDSSRFSNDEAILEEDSVINKNDNLAILPPVSGG